MPRGSYIRSSLSQLVAAGSLDCAGRACYQPAACGSGRSPLMGRRWIAAGGGRRRFGSFVAGLVDCWQGHGATAAEGIVGRRARTGCFDRVLVPVALAWRREVVTLYLLPECSFEAAVTTKLVIIGTIATGPTADP